MASREQRGLVGMPHYGDAPNNSRAWPEARSMRKAFPSGKKDSKKRRHLHMQRHLKLLIWKSYLQRQRRWQILLIETLFAGVFFVTSVFIAKPVFLTPITDAPGAALTDNAILSALQKRTIVGYAPNTNPYDKVMKRAADLLRIKILEGSSESDLNNLLYNKSQGSSLNNSVIWVIWKTSDYDIWKFSIKSSELARLEIQETKLSPEQHLSTGFLSVQLAVSQAIVEHVSKTTPKFELSLVAMPVSPLMLQPAVKRALAGILLCFTVALLPPVLEIEALVVTESASQLKRALRIRDVSFSSIYVGWLMYAYLTAVPICLLASITLILIFRWIHLLFAFIIVLAYKTVLIMLALIMAMFHNRAWIACTWTLLFTLMQTFISELLVHHKFDIENKALTFVLQVILPPLGLVHAFNEFALLQTGREFDNVVSLVYPILSWLLMIAFYFFLLMMLQRTISFEKAIGGQVPWKTVIFKKSADMNKLHRIESLTGTERDNLQAVDELVAKAISFRNVSKSMMGSVVLNNVTFDVYRGEFTMIIADRNQYKTIVTLADLFTGLTFADKGTINVLGQELRPGSNFMNVPYMTGFCHRNHFLIHDLTVEEHLILFLEICLWHETNENIIEYSQVRIRQLLKEGDLEVVKDKQIKYLDVYYQAQLCWAIALLLEPRIIIIDNFSMKPAYDKIIKDKVMRYKKYITILKFSFASIKMEFADRVFLFHDKTLIFGGTPAYMFFKYGREYRLRLAFDAGLLENDAMAEILRRAQGAGARVRANLGTMLILMVPAFPTATVAAFVKELTINTKEYGITSIHISVPDSQEVCQRAINESKSRVPLYETIPPLNLSSSALVQIAEHPLWKRKTSGCCGESQIKAFGRKYYAFYAYYKIYFIVMMTSSALAGIAIGLIQSDLLVHLEIDASKSLHGELLNVESRKQNTTLVLLLDNSTDATSVANNYILSDTYSTDAEIDLIEYTALAEKESLTEYLVTRAIDSPQHYVRLYAYGIEIYDKNNTLKIRVLHSPPHQDSWTAPRSLARTFMALLRHYTGKKDATIQVTDDPLGLDLARWLTYAGHGPLLEQFLLALTILHMTYIPSKEHGLIRHMQCHAMNFSPVRYWFTMFVCDLVLYTILVCFLTALSIAVVYLVTPPTYFHFDDLAILPLLIIVYGIGSIPQAYLFSLGPQAALNSMIFIIVNVMLGETAVITNIQYGDAWSYILQFSSFSPQFNLAHAYAKIKENFLYNMECGIFKSKNLCTKETLHKCCEKCGVLQQCFQRRSYLFDQENGIFIELVAILITCCIFMSILLLWEYRVIQHVWMYVVKIACSVRYVTDSLAFGVQREKEEAVEKQRIIKTDKKLKVKSFGEYLLAVDVAKKRSGECIIRHLYLGLEKGEVKAVSGLMLHGRRNLCEILAGYKIPADGKLWAMSTWEVRNHPHKYARNIALCSNRNPLPPWMTVIEGLKLLATLRGIPIKYVKHEVENYINALDLHENANTCIGKLQPMERIKVHFAAAVVGAPPILIMDEFTAHQKNSVRRAMYFILRQLTKRGHAIVTASNSVETHLPMTNRLAIILHGLIYDIDDVEVLVERCGKSGFTVVLHLKDEVDVKNMLYRYFDMFVINDMSEVLVNVQILDSDLTWMTIFEKLEMLVAENATVYTYIVTAIPIDYIYNWILSHETRHAVKEYEAFSFLKKRFGRTPKIKPTEETLSKLIPFEQKYNITQLKELPWSVIFQR